VIASPPAASPGGTVIRGAGSGPGYVSHPDEAKLLPGGQVPAAVEPR